MIKNHDRSMWFGASDASMVVGNWGTKTFASWWAEKCGLKFAPKFNNKYTLAGTYYEHAILDVLGCEKDKQILIPEIKLRVNYDGTIGKEIHEVKTFKEDKDFKVSAAYWRQAQVQMYVLDSDNLTIEAYPLSEEHYKNYFLPIDKDKILHNKVPPDKAWINDEYLLKNIYLSECLSKGKFPTKEGYNGAINITRQKAVPYHWH